MKSRRFVLSLALLTLGLDCLGATIRVPQDQPTIQAGIDAASDGDTVLVAPGTYFENIDFKAKAIIVRSSDGPTNTIIDGGARAPVVTFSYDEVQGSTLSGFTIR